MCAFDTVVHYIIYSIKPANPGAPAGHSAFNGFEAPAEIIKNHTVVGVVFIYLVTRRSSLQFLLAEKINVMLLSSRRQATVHRTGRGFVKDGFPGCTAPKAPLCKGGCHANSVTGGLLQ